MLRSVVVLIVLSLGLASAQVAEPVGGPPTPPPLQPQADYSRSAPYLGDKTYTLHVAGTVSDALLQLRKETNLYFGLRDDAPEGQGPPPTHAKLLAAPVMLDFKNATLDRILLSLCEQAGLVYEVSSGDLITLRPGDRRLDCRATAKVGDLTVYVTDLEVISRSRHSLGWGWETPRQSQRDGYLAVTVQVGAKSPEAMSRVVGFGGFKAVTDTGDTLLPPDGGKALVLPRVSGQGGPLSALYSCRTQIALAVPPDGASRLARLEASLVLTSDATTLDIRVPAGAAPGESFEQGGIRLTVQSSRQLVDGFEMVLRRTDAPQAAPAVAAAPGAPQETPSEPDRVFVVDKQGREVPAAVSTSRGEGGTTVSLFFPLVKQPEAVRYVATRRGAPDKLLPFVIENIPIP